MAAATWWPTEDTHPWAVKSTCHTVRLFMGLNNLYIIVYNNNNKKTALKIRCMNSHTADRMLSHQTLMRRWILMAATGWPGHLQATLQINLLPLGSLLEVRQFSVRYTQTHTLTERPSPRLKSPGLQLFSQLFMPNLSLIYYIKRQIVSKIFCYGRKRESRLIRMTFLDWFNNYCKFSQRFK